ncbi:unnamed protein product [Boreogadus saida]
MRKYHVLYAPEHLVVQGQSYPLCFSMYLLEKPITPFHEENTTTPYLHYLQNMEENSRRPQAMRHFRVRRPGQLIDDTDMMFFFHISW